MGLDTSIDCTRMAAKQAQADHNEAWKLLMEIFQF